MQAFSFEDQVAENRNIAPGGNELFAARTMGAWEYDIKYFVFRFVREAYPAIFA
jgi:hypothetical protein